MAVENIGFSVSGNSVGWNFSNSANGYKVNDSPEISRPGYAVNGDSEKGHGIKAPTDENDRKRRFDSYECQTCENRKYQDGSDDSGVSYQTPTRIDPKTAASAVRGHEQEHVVRNQAKAEMEGKEIVSQSVTLHTGICEECGRVYIAGGTTRTVTKDADDSNRFDVGVENKEKGTLLNMAV